MIAAATWDSDTSGAFGPTLAVWDTSTINLENDVDGRANKSVPLAGLHPRDHRGSTNATSRRAESDVAATDVVNTIFDNRASSAAFAPGGGPVRTMPQGYQARIEALRVHAAADGCFVSPASEFDFWHFVKSRPHGRQGNLVLMDSGNLRASWRDGKGTHLGVQFLGDGMVQFVIFKRREPQGPFSRVAGRDTIHGLTGQIDAFDLHALLHK